VVAEVVDLEHVPGGVGHSRRGGERWTHGWVQQHLAVEATDRAHLLGHHSGQRRTG